MKLNKTLIQFILSVIGIVFAFFMVALLFFIEVPVPNRDLISMAIGIILAKCVGGVYDFWVGSSKSSQDKTDLLSKDNTAP
jgi:hypothetical protein